MRKIIILIMSFLVIESLVGCGVKAIPTDKVFNKKEETKSNESEKVVYKDENVYVMMHADGSLDHVIVSDWLKNVGNAKVKDKTTLKDIENVKGNEKYQINDDTLTWFASGKDIYYQGISAKQVPITMQINYELDGKKIEPDNLLGKSGHLKISIKYINNLKQSVIVGNKKEAMYVPFIAITGMILDNNIFHNVDITNGKLINDGDKSIILGYALPGIIDDLKLSDIDKLDEVVMESDVIDFKMGISLTMVSNEIFNEVNSNSLDNLSSLNSNIDKLTASMSQLLVGSGKLKDGLKKLYNKSKQFVDGINQLSDGSNALVQGSGDLSIGVSKYQEGVNQLSDGLTALDENRGDLRSGSKQIFNSLLSQVNQQLSEAGIKVDVLTIENYEKTLNDVIASLDKDRIYQQAYQQVSAQVEAKRGEIQVLVEQAVRKQVEAEVSIKVNDSVLTQIKNQVEANRDLILTQVLSQSLGIDINTYQQLIASGSISENQQKQIEDQVNVIITNKVNEQYQSDAVQNQIKQLIQNNTDDQMQSDNIKAIIKQQVDNEVEKAILAAMNSDEVQEKLNKASDGAKKIIDAKTQLDSYKVFYMAIISYTDGVHQACNGASVLKERIIDIKDGCVQLNDGSKAISKGISALKQGSNQLIAGIKQLFQGSKKLDDGLNQYNEKAIQKISDLFNNQLGNVKNRIKAMLQLAKGYKNFSGLDNDMNGCVKFIYRSEEIE